MDEEVALEAFIERLRSDVWFLIIAFREWYAEKRARDPETWTEQLTLLEWQHALSAFLLECPAAFRPPEPEPLPPRTILPPPPPEEFDDVPPKRRPDEEPPDEGPPPPWFRVQGFEDD